MEKARVPLAPPLPPTAAATHTHTSSCSSLDGEITNSQEPLKELSWSRQVTELVNSVEGQSSRTRTPLLQPRVDMHKSKMV